MFCIRSGLVLLLLALTGCATLNQQECQSLNPATLGRSDGRQGYGLWRLESHVKSCARFGISIDRAAYLQARSAALPHYCTPENGELVGSRGESYEGVCPAELENGFLQRYRPAYRRYQNDMLDGRSWFGWPRRV